MPLFREHTTGILRPGVVWDGEPKTLEFLNSYKDKFRVWPFSSGCLMLEGNMWWSCPVGSLVVWEYPVTQAFLVSWISKGKYSFVVGDWDERKVWKSQGTWNPFENI